MPGFSRRSAIISIVSSQARVIISTTASSVGRRSSSPNPSTRFVSSMWRWSSSSGVPMNEPITRETTGPATSLTRSTSPRSSTRSSTRLTIPRIRSSCSAIRFGREAALEQRLDPVVARRVHRDHLLLLALERDPEVVEDHDPADVEENVCQSRLTAAQVGGPGQRPEAGLVGVLAERAPVDGRLAAQPGEELVRRAVVPELEVAEVDPVEVRCDRSRRSRSRSRAYYRCSGDDADPGSRPPRRRSPTPRSRCSRPRAGAG